jgi:hypothetical protein
MWCAKCHADVAAEVTPDNARARCATCHAELGIAAAVRAADKTREARALLERWSTSRVLDPFGPVTAARPAIVEPLPAEPARPSGTMLSVFAPASGPASALPPTPAPVPVPAAPGAESSADPEQDRDVRERPAPAPRKFRLDTAHSLPEMHAPRRPIESHRREAAIVSRSNDEPDEPSAADDFHDPRARRRSGRRAAASERIDVQTAILDDGPRRTNWFQLAGHLLAYAGALVLTIGMALVLVGCFGGPHKVHFTPTGWLIATFGQLLLVSGVITLLSSGMERSSREISQRLEELGERLLRFEQAEDQFPSGPRLTRRRTRAGQRAELHSQSGF